MYIHKAPEDSPGLFISQEAQAWQTEGIDRSSEISRHSGKTMNKIEFFIFGAMMVYIVVLIVMYMQSEPIRGYEIQMGSLSVAKTYTGIALRQEEVIATPYTGYINYYIREGESIYQRYSVFYR